MDTVFIASGSLVVGNFSLAANGIEILRGQRVDINGTAGNNSIDFKGILLDGIAAVHGMEGNDTISGFARAVVVFGDAGDDSITGSAGNDKLRGGDGNDTLIGGAGDDILEGGYAPYSTDTESLFGGTGNDTLYGYGADTLDGGEGDDLLDISGQQVYSLQGGAGTDTLTVATYQWIIANFSLAANGIEVVRGEDATIYGTSVANAIDFTGVALNGIAAVGGGGG